MTIPKSTVSVNPGTPLRERFLIDLLRVTALVCFGTTGFMVLEKWNFLDSLYMTVTTLTTVGYGEVHPLSDAGKCFAIVFLLCGVAVAVYVLSDIVQIFMSINWSRRRMKQKIVKLVGHQIVCGYGRTGQEVCAQLRANDVPFVVIDNDPAHAKKAEDEGFLVVEGDASSDEILIESQIRTAKGIVCALPEDTANTFIVLSAKGLNENITIVSRAANPGSEGKLRRAGAAMVISPYVICGRRLAASVTHPLVTEFLDVVMHAPGYDLRMEQVSLNGASSIVGATLKDANIKQTSGAMILAVRQNGKLLTNPSPDHLFHEGDELIALGTDQELKKLASLASTRKS
jgi:voltage-gated potassium channel